jgi:xylulokinase
MAAQPYASYAPQPGWLEQYPDDWWAALRVCTQSLWAQALPPNDILAISVTAHMHGVIPVRSGAALMPCITLFDQRASEQAKAIREVVGADALYRTTGGRFESYAPLAKIAWVREHRPELFAQTDLFLAPKDVLRVMLGGAPVTDVLDAAGSLAYDLVDEAWSAALLTALGLPAEKFPQICSPFAAAGRLSAAAADWLGLTAGTPLLTGAGDDIEALGAGLIAPGQTIEHIGTTGTVLSVVAEPLFDPAGRVEVYPGALTGQYLIGGATNAAGRSLDWARGWLHLGTPADAPLPLADYDVASDGDAPFYLPFINGERGLLWNDDATGALWGLRGAHGAAELARAIYEGVAFSLKELVAANAVLGAPIRAVVSGAVNSSPLWSQLRADVYGLPLVYGRTDYLTGLGAAILALVQQGAFPSAEAAVAVCCQGGEQVEPRPQHQQFLQVRYAKYRQIVQANHGLYVS